MDRLHREQAAILSAYTGILCGPFSDLRDYVQKKLGGELITDTTLIVLGEEGVKRLATEDFLAITAEE